MKRVYAIHLIACFVLLVNNNGLTEGHTLKKFFSGLKNFKTLWHGILPGTLWCGLGDIARDDLELGAHKELDMCCRAHDKCEDFVEPKSSRYGLQNKHICRLSLCECEMQFYDCLKQVNGLYAFVIGQIYFAKCRRCFSTYNDAQECAKEGLNINEEQDRKGSRVFCAKFDRNPKWGQRHNVSESTPNKFLDLDDDDDDNDNNDDENFINGGKHPIEEDDIIYDYYKSFQQ